MRRSSLILSNPDVRFHSEAVDVLGLSGGKILGDEGPGTGVGTGFRKGEVTRDEAGEAERSEPLTSLLFPASETVATDDCFLFFLMKSPGVVVRGEPSEEGVVDGAGDVGVTGVAGPGVCAVGELADELPPPQSLRTPFICSVIDRLACLQRAVRNWPASLGKSGVRSSGGSFRSGCL
jgi:hypothetical protein